MENGEVSKRPIMVKSSTTIAIEQQLRKAKENDVVTYEQLDKIVGGSVRTDYYTNLQSARRILLNDGVVFDTVSKLGLKRLDDESASKLLASIPLRQHKLAIKGRKVAACIDYAKLGSDGKVRYNTATAQISVIHQASSGKFRDKLENRVKELGTTLSLQKTLEAFNS